MCTDKDFDDLSEKEKLEVKKFSETVKNWSVKDVTEQAEKYVFMRSQEEVARWFHEDSGILETCLNKENQLQKMFGQEQLDCPFFESFIQLFIVNLHKGWSREQIVETLMGMDIDGIETHQAD